MLYYGSSNMIPYLSYDTIVYNITSFKEGLNKLNLLPPLDKRLFQDNGREFDILYAQWIMTNDNIFFDFFKIIYNLYLGKEVFLTVDSADWSENIIESILKLIQQRYGYNGAYIEDFDSYLYAKNNMLGHFDPTYGLHNLDLDRDRFTVLMAKANPKLLNIVGDG